MMNLDINPPPEQPQERISEPETHEPTFEEMMAGPNATAPVPTPEVEVHRNSNPAAMDLNTLNNLYNTSS
jgi:hypothetical protein